MQLKKIAKICRNEKEIRVLKIMNDRGEIVRSFVGTKYALFAVDDLTDLSKDVMLTIFDVPKTDRNAWTYAEDLRADYEPLEDTWPEKLSAAAVPTGLWIRYKGEEVCEFAVKEVRRLYID
ncbi:MAG: hypothetical protein Q4A88_06545, partial [Clostridia bacterium]|nr:hypothetical protein [Clostridia bacterium]